MGFIIKASEKLDNVMRWLESKYFDVPVKEYLLGPDKPRKPNKGMNLPPGAFVQDYKYYDATQMSRCPELLEVERKLAARGLKSPWLRNDIWRYDQKYWASTGYRRYLTYTMGFKYAIPLLILTAIYEWHLKGPAAHHYHGFYAEREAAVKGHTGGHGGHH